MKYFFEAEFEKKDNHYVMQIPFNVWEVARQRDVIEGEVVLEGRTIACQLLPKEKGNYEIHIDANMVDGLEESKDYEVLLHIGGTLVRMDQDSPYSVENPIRHIDSMQVQMQPEDGLCGQACVAMLAGVSIEEVISEMDCREWQATMGRMISALNHYGIGHSEVIYYTEGRNVVLPKCCIMMEKMGRFCHYLVYFDGKYYDSNLGVLGEYDMSKMLGYLEIKC